MQELLNKLVKKNVVLTKDGRVADYIPELDKAKKDALGVCILDNEGNRYTAGDWEIKFTVQSISKLVTLMLAILDNGEEFVFSKVGM
ncbi:MAG: glutaminase, partial [Candidatus Fusobacterium pullicola]|nr:glutaminase [Candidatus Fusobacterium pullicola]